MKISKGKAIDLINETKGKVFTVEFVKRTTGEVRKMNARTRVRNYVTGEGMKYNPSSKNLITVFDMAIAKTLPKDQRHKAYRHINVDGLKTILANRKLYEVIHD